MFVTMLPEELRKMSSVVKKELRVKAEPVWEHGENKESYIENLEERSMTEDVCVKREGEIGGLCLKEGREASIIEEKGCKSINVKEEECEDERECKEEKNEEGMKELYEGHEVKRELVVGPETLQPQDITYSMNVLYAVKFNQKHEADTPIRFPTQRTLASCNFKKHGLRLCSVVLQRIDDNLTFDQKVSFVKQEKKINESYNGDERDNYKSSDKLELTTSTHAEFHRRLQSRHTFVKTKKVKHYQSKKCFICDFCAKQFTLRMNFITHLRTHTGEKPYRCELCKKRFTDVSTLIRHRRTHTGEKPHSCEDCGKKFSEKYLLVNHRRIHTGDKPYSCPKCGKLFSNTSNLGRHLSVHASRPFPCEICEKLFTLESHLKGHIISNHAKDKPFICNVCEKRFIKRFHLNRHLKIHEKDKYLSCEQCKVHFSQNSALKRHIQRQVCVKRRDARSY